MDFASTLFNPFQNRLEIPLYHIVWIGFWGKFMDIISIFANYYVNIDNIYKENEIFVRHNQMEKLQYPKYKPSRYINIIRVQLTRQLPDGVVDIIIAYLSSVMQTDADKKQITLMLFKHEWYTQHGISSRSRRIWHFIYQFYYVWSICRGIIWSTSFIILMYEYHLMRSQYSVDNYVLFLWILGYFHPNLLHSECMVVAIISITSMFNSDENVGDVISDDDTLNSRSFESLKMAPKVWQVSNIIGGIYCCLGGFTAIYPLYIPGLVIYSPFLLAFLGLPYFFIWLSEKLERFTVLSVLLIIVPLPFYILALYFNYIWYNIVSVGGLYCFYKNGEWWQCLVDSFNIQERLVLPQPDDWKMIIVLLAMIF